MLSFPTKPLLPIEEFNGKSYIPPRNPPETDYLLLDASAAEALYIEHEEDDYARTGSCRGFLEFQTLRLLLLRF